MSFDEIRRTAQTVKPKPATPVHLLTPQEVMDLSDRLFRPDQHSAAADWLETQYRIRMDLKALRAKRQQRRDP